MAKHYNSMAMTYSPCKVQEQVEAFVNSGNDMMEIVIPAGRELTSVRGSFTQAIKSTRRRAKMMQKQGKLYITRI